MIIHGDCVDVMEDLIKKKVRFESIVTDPPYELGFMGKDWDKSGIANSKYMWSLAFKLLQPGGHLLAFSSTRTYHRMVVAIEDAGFEIRDMISWLYGQGFPKSWDVAKGIDGLALTGNSNSRAMKKANESRPGEGKIRNQTQNGTNRFVGGEDTGASIKNDNPITDEAKQWQGWGTALKPACEPIVVARKPLIKGYTVVENVLTTGTGGLNIDDCRIGADGPSPSLGRWPANVVHDGSDEVEEVFAAFGNKGGGFGKSGGSPDGKGIYGKQFPRGDMQVVGFGDSGSASRFFYCAKSSKRERAGSKHPTVKPLALMKWLVTLVTPPDGTVLDPFCGTGTTCVAAKELGFDFVGIELDEETAEFARSRVNRQPTVSEESEDFRIEGDLFETIGE